MPDMFAPDPSELSVLIEGTRLLDEAKSLRDIKSLRDKAEAARTFVKAARLGLEKQNRAAELKLRAERKAGSLLRSLQLRGGNRRSSQLSTSSKLQDLGISRDQSRRWQRLASISNEEFSKYLRDAVKQGRQITGAGLLQMAAKPHTKTTQWPLRPSIFRATDPESVDERFSELTSRCRTLAEVLRPVYEEGAIELRVIERRTAGRLIGEIIQLIGEMKQLWSKSNPR